MAKVTVVDDNDLNGGICDEAILDIKTSELKKMTNVTGQGHKFSRVACNDVLNPPNSIQNQRPASGNNAVSAASS